ncbi:MAG TPA: aromatic ring-hydroxylating dioxygenase subunit alpha [Lacipirellulaceae bacterium]|nr:aromatic ring-hydroxylating dioxygenase subunit alpha [Lacipirellulaceae bacterium]
MLRTNLPREYFVSAEIFDRETERIFSRSWICVGHVSEFQAAPSYNVVQIGSYSIVVSRPATDEIYAFHNVCRHRGARLCSQPQGEMKNESLTCPYHAWTYDAKGRLIGAPNMADQAEFARNDFPLVRVAASVWNGFVMLNLQAEGANFAKDYGPLVERLVNWSRKELSLVETLHYEVRCNWKMLFQNYSECYHCPTVHPKLSRLTPYRSATNDLTSGPFLGGPMELDHGFETISQNGKLVSRRFPDLTEQQQSCVYYYTVFPTMFVSAHPDYVMVHVLSRKERALTDVACHFFVSKSVAGQSKVDLSRATSLWDEVNRQDWEMCELTQLGAESPAFQPGPYSTLEPMVYAFDRHYLSVMEPRPT